MKRFVVVLLAVSCVLVTGGMADAGSLYPPVKPTCEISNTTARVGDQIVVSGDGWQVNSSVSLRFTQTAPTFEKSLGTAPTNGVGHFAKQITIPDGAHAGEFVVEVTGLDQSGAPVECDPQIGTILSSGGGGGGGGLAFTGFALWVWLALGLALLALGAGLLLAARERSSKRPPRSRRETLRRRSLVVLAVAAVALAGWALVVILVGPSNLRLGSFARVISPAVLAVVVLASLIVAGVARRQGRAEAR